MDRIIKFRAKASRNDEWVYGYFTKFGDVYYITTGDVTDTIKLETLGQFTGLTDKNGKEIYEGDILTKDGLFFNGSPSRHIIQWGGVLNCDDRGDGEYYYGWSFPSYKAYEWEIIGNVYENPIEKI